MATGRSKVTAQGRVSIPAEIRKKLGIVPGSTLQWEEKGGEITVRKKGDLTFAEIRKILFPDGPPERKTLKELKQGISNYIRKRHASGRY
jgi:AbrB family looped-hinge helix DNA binding protein